jgi:hypothetical protein
MVSLEEMDYKLYKTGDDCFTVKFGRIVVVSEGSYEEASRAMLISLDIPAAETMKATAEMELGGHNLAVFGMDKRFLECLTHRFDS